jgi:hypothetical protein
MKKALRNLENGSLRVVRNTGDRNLIKYEPIKCREEELKEVLRKKIEFVENNDRYYEKNEYPMSHSYAGKLMQH